MMKYVLFYETAPDGIAKVPPIFPAHKARLDAFHARGDLLQVGTFENPAKQGSMGLFATREAAEEFVREDPFVLNGVVASWKIWGWNQTFE
jgi:uncharacterized protein YciI